MVELIAFGTILFVCIYWLVFPPKKPNSIFGYRTPLSMQSLENWRFSNNYAPRLLSPFIALAFILIVIHKITPFFYAEPLAVGLLFSGILLTLILTESQLRKRNNDKK